TLKAYAVVLSQVFGHKRGLSLTGQNHAKSQMYVLLAQSKLPIRSVRPYVHGADATTKITESLHHNSYWCRASHSCAFWRSSRRSASGVISSHNALRRGGESSPGRCPR